MKSESEIFDNLVIPDENQRNDLRKKAAEYVLLEDEIAAAEQKLKEMKEQLNILSTKELPELMAACGIDAFRLQSGAEIVMDNFMSGSLPKEDELRAKGIQHLTELGGEATIKNYFEIELGTKDNARAEKLAKFLDKEKLGYARDMSVHAGTLKKFAKEAMKAGKDVKLGVLGLYAGRFVKVKRAVED